MSVRSYSTELDLTMFAPSGGDAIQAIWFMPAASSFKATFTAFQVHAHPGAMILVQRYSSNLSGSAKSPPVSENARDFVLDTQSPIVASATQNASTTSRIFPTSFPVPDNKFLQVVLVGNDASTGIVIPAALPQMVIQPGESLCIVSRGATTTNSRLWMRVDHIETAAP